MNFKKNMGGHHHAYLYGMKVHGKMHWGPYALLSRDHAFKPGEIGNHDYLGAPEIVEDICLCFSEKFEFDLLGAFMKKTKPCVVKFVAGPGMIACLPPCTTSTTTTAGTGARFNVTPVLMVRAWPFPERIS